MARLGELGYAVRALRGYFAVNLPVGPTVQRDFRLDTLSALLFGVFNGSVISFLYVVGRTIGVSPFAISVMVAMPALGAILSLPISLVMQGRNARGFMFTAWALGRGVMVLTVFFSAPLPYVIIASVFLISSSIASPFYAAVMQHVYPREFRGRLMSLVRVGSGLMTTLTSLLVGVLLGDLHVRFGLVFAVGTFCALVSLLIFSHVTPVRAAPRPRQSLRDTFGILRRDRRFAVYQAAVFVMGFGNIIGGTLYPLVVVDKLHAGYSAFGVLTVLSSAGYLASFFVWGRVVDRTGPLFTMLLVGSCVTLMPLGMLLAPGVWWLIPVAVLTGITLAGFELGVFSAVIHYSSPPDVPLYMGLHSIFAGIRGLIAPFVAIAILRGHHFSPALTSGLLLCLLGTVVIWNGARTEDRAALQAAPSPQG